MKRIKKEPYPSIEIPLKAWQADVLDWIGDEPDDRHIHWFYDETGAAGKTTFAKYLMGRYQDVAYFTSSKGTDIKYAYSG